MKLDDYSMREAFRNRDWHSALSTLTKYFDIKIASSKLILSCDKKGLFWEIVISCERTGCTYFWDELDGFYGNSTDSPAYFDYAVVEVFYDEDR